MKAEPAQTTAIRRALLWWFRWPGNPYVTINVAVDFAPAQAYLAALGPPRVTVNHVVAAAIARTLAKFPSANARVVGKRIVRPPHVGIAMPVSLLGHAGGERSEVALALLERAETLTLRQVADATTKTVAAEREGKPQNALVRRITRLVEAAPEPIVSGTLGLLDRAMQRSAVARQVYGRVPITTGLSNAGAAMGRPPGMLFRGADIALPQRIVHIGTFWGFSAVQDEVVAVDGRPVVRPMLPVLFLFDHRLLDGVMSARILSHFGEILRNPAAEFGLDGHRAPGRPS